MTFCSNSCATGDQLPTAKFDPSLKLKGLVVVPLSGILFEDSPELSYVRGDKAKQERSHMCHILTQAGNL